MTDIKFEILKSAYDQTHRLISRSELLKESGRSINQVNYAIDELVFSKLLKENIGSDYLSLTSKGAVEYELEYESRQLKAEEDEHRSKQYKFNRNTTLASLIIAGVSIIVAVLAIIF